MSLCARCRWGTGKNHRCHKPLTHHKVDATLRLHKCKYFELLKTVGKGTFSGLLKAIFCPVCGSELDIEEKDGKKQLVCPRDGEMKVYLDRDPKASELSRVCGALGIEDWREH